MNRAYATAPPAEGQAVPQAADLAGELHPLVVSLTTALAANPNDPGTSGVPKQVAQDVANQLLGGATFNTGRFVIAFLIFAALVGGGIACEATHLTTATGTLFGFAGAIFGIVTAFLGTESAASNQG